MIHNSKACYTLKSLVIIDTLILCGCNIKAALLSLGFMSYNELYNKRQQKIVFGHTKKKQS